MEPAPAVLLRQMRAPDKRNGKAHERKIMEILQKTKPWRQVVKVGVLYAAGAGGMDLLVSDGTAVLFRGKAVRESLAESNRDHNTGAGLDS